jgi:hypothetical protein
MINRWIWQYTPFLDKPMRSKQRSTKIRVPPISLSYTGYCVYIYSISHFLYPRFLMDFSIPHFFYFIHMKKHMPIPAPMVQYWIYSNHVEATLRPVLHGGPAGSPLSSSSLRGRWGMTPVDGFFLRKNWCLTLFNLQHRGFRWWLLTCWEGGAFWG